MNLETNTRDSDRFYTGYMLRTVMITECFRH